MKSFLLLFFLFSFLCCDETIMNKENINDVTIVLSFSEEYVNDIVIYHVYFYNNQDKSKSKGFNIAEINKEFKTNIFPGIYDIYVYGLVEKTESSLKVFSYDYSLKLKCFNDIQNLKINLKELIPDFKLNTDLVIPMIKISMSGISDLFSLSSLSIKQGSDRVRSLDLIYDKDKNIYTAEIPVYDNGLWLMNISYSLKSKINKSALSNDNLYISTSYFKDIYLGEYYLLEK